jgi:hypothetical protein
VAQMWAEPASRSAPPAFLASVSLPPGEARLRRRRALALVES